MFRGSLIALAVFFQSLFCFAQGIKITPDMHDFSKNSITGIHLCTPRHVRAGDCSDVDDEYYRNLAIITLGSYEIGLLEVNGTKTIAFKGPLSPGSAKNLINILDTYHETVDTLVLSSQGGSLEEAYLIADYVREKKLNTWVPTRRMCLSACSVVFFNGKTKILEGLLGLHSGSFYLRDPYQIRDINVAQATIKKALYQKEFYMLKQVRLYMEIGISLDVIDAIIEAKGEFLVVDDLERLYSFDPAADYIMTNKKMIEHSDAQAAVNFDFQGYTQLF